MVHVEAERGFDVSDGEDRAREPVCHGNWSTLPYSY
jgi:hypothetical protein